MQLATRIDNAPKQNQLYRRSRQFEKPAPFKSVFQPNSENRRTQQLQNVRSFRVRQEPNPTLRQSANLHVHLAARTILIHKLDLKSAD